ncbi:hypothetical protein BaRGS_00013247 [Batillaria attramentaria]|uniref:Sushi domain-containing protein n=1 Tax=Batillaria attramentaria TaxID=370345 RepID=A0ABD0L8W1_9CAEN
MPTTPYLTCRDSPAAISNGHVWQATNVSAEYYCEDGFYLLGNKRITCDTSTGSWGTPPSCNLIFQPNQHTVNVYDESDIIDDWWLYFLAVVLGLLVVCFMVCLVCHFCCGARVNAIYPFYDQEEGVCCSCCRPSRHGGRDVTSYEENGVRSPSQVGTQMKMNNIYWYGSNKNAQGISPARPAKEVKDAWMPHSKPVRVDHNTSTK